MKAEDVLQSLEASRDLYGEGIHLLSDGYVKVNKHGYFIERPREQAWVTREEALALLGKYDLEESNAS